MAFNTLRYTSGAVRRRDAPKEDGEDGRVLLLAKQSIVAQKRERTNLVISRRC